MNQSPPRDPRQALRTNHSTATTELLVKFLVPDHRVSFLSAPIVRQACAVSGARLGLSQPSSFFPGSEDERTTTLTGPPQGVRTALVSIVDEIEEDRRNPMLHIVVPATSAAHIVAAGAAALRNISAQTQTQIVVLPALPNFDERVLRITRLPHAFEHPAALVAAGAVQLIEHLHTNDRYYTPYQKVDYPTSYRNVRPFPDQSASSSPSPPPGYVQSPAPSPVPMFSMAANIASNPTGVITPPQQQQEQPKSRIEALRDQLLRLAKVEQASRQESIGVEPSAWTGEARTTPGTPPAQEPALIPMYNNLSQDAIKKAAEIAANNADVLDLKCFIRIPFVTNRACSAIIGVGGSVIQDIMDCTGARVRVNQDTGSPAKEVTIIGPVHAVHSALIAVYDIINRVSRGDDSLKGTAVASWLRETMGKPHQIEKPARDSFRDIHPAPSRDHRLDMPPNRDYPPREYRDHGPREFHAGRDAPRDPRDHGPGPGPGPGHGHGPRDFHGGREGYGPRDAYPRDFGREPPRDYDPYPKRFRR